MENPRIISALTASGYDKLCIFVIYKKNKTCFHACRQRLGFLELNRSHMPDKIKGWLIDSGKNVIKTHVFQINPP